MLNMFVETMLRVAPQLLRARKRLYYWADSSPARGQGGRCPTRFAGGITCGIGNCLIRTGWVSALFEVVNQNGYFIRHI